MLTDLADNEFEVVEIQLHEDAEYADGLLQWKEGVIHDYSTSMYEEIGDEESHDYQPCTTAENVILVTKLIQIMKKTINQHCFSFSFEKGGFGDVYVETDGEDFDPELLQTGQIESDMGEIIESYWYDLSHYRLTLTMQTQWAKATMQVLAMLTLSGTTSRENMRRLRYGRN